MPVVSRDALVRAVQNVSSWGDTDVFPFPIENHVLHDKVDDVVALLEGVSNNFVADLARTGVSNYSTLAPVGYFGFRWATQIDPIWNVYLLALVLELAPDLEATRIPESEKKVFSYRFRPNTDDGSLFAAGAWRDFQTTTRELASASEFVVSLDIADFYARIYHHPLENALKRADRGGNVAFQIVRLLSTFSNNTSYGIPVGGPAARLLAEVVLNKVDHLLLVDEHLSTFCRYADDYRFFVPDMAEAHRVIAVLSEKLLRNEGLTIQKAKTRIMSSREYLAVLDPPNPEPGSAAAFLGLHIHYDPYSATSGVRRDRKSTRLNSSH